MDDNNQMRTLIEIAQYYSVTSFLESQLELVTEEVLPEAVIEEVKEPVLNEVIKKELEDLMFKMRAFSENSGGEFALGVETGMQRSADMIANLIERITNGDF